MKHLVYFNLRCPYEKLDEFIREKDGFWIFLETLRTFSLPIVIAKIW